MEEISPILEGNFVARFSTHTPILHDYQMILSTGVREYCSEAWLKLLGGTNLIKTSLISKKPGWNLNPISARLYEGAVGVGVGIGGNGGIKNTYTRNIYRRVLSRRYVHSTRDQRTADVLSGLGAHAVNTGCPTMWALTPEHCATIPTGRARSVIFTVTDYAADPQADLGILQVLERNYEEIFVWIQGSRDYEYLQELGVLSRISIVGPSVKAYRDFLVANDVDYVGTRLHGGYMLCAIGVEPSSWPLIIGRWIFRRLTT